MCPEKFELLLKNFKAYENELKEYIEQDPDFRKLCTEYEEIGQAVRYLQNLTKVPIRQIEKQLEAQEELLNELEQEIELFIKFEKR